MKKNARKGALLLKRLKLKGFNRNHPFVIPLTTLMLVFVVSMGLIIFSGGSTIEASDRRIVNLTIDGEQQAIPTRATTVGDLVERLEIPLKEEDIVEPSITTEITDNNFSINIYTARTVTVIDKDSGQEVTTVTAHPEPRDVAKAAGLTVYPEDIITHREEPTTAEDVIRGGFVLEEVVIDRATPVTVNLYGKTITLRTHAQTVGEVLAERNIKTLNDDVLTPSVDTPLTNKTQIFVVRTGSQIETVEEPIPAPVETIQDPNAPIGNTVVREAGSDGQKVVTYEILLENDQEVSRKVLQEVIAVEPIKRVVVEGTKVIISNPSANVAIGQQLAAQRGWTGAQWGCLYQLWQKESGWNHLAMNRSSGAYGIPQSLPGSKMASVGSDWQTNPATQITWGLNYIAGHRKYGTPCAAWSHSEAVNWY